MAKKIKNFKQANEVLRQYYDNAHTPYTLDNMQQLMAFLGNPQDQLQVVHVAGTSGKTSTAYYVAALLQAAGLRTGLTISPHVDEINERVQLDLESLPEKVFCEALTRFLRIIEPSEVKPSYFEFLVAFAYWYFANADVDVAVVEVGLGGLLDGTNVISRSDKLCIITDIGLDHTSILGNTITAITAQKAGIIQTGNHVFMHQQSLPVMGVVQQACVKQAAQLHVVPLQADLSTIRLPLFQQRNFNLALAAANFWFQKPLTDKQVKQATEVYIPARMEVIKRGQQCIILDGAHNGQKLQALMASIQASFPNQQMAALVGFVEGEEPRMHSGLDQIIGLAEQLIITSFYTEKDYAKHSVDPKAIATYLHSRGYPQVHIEPDPVRAFDLLLQRPEPLLLVTGSFYLLNHIRPLIPH